MSDPDWINGDPADLRKWRDQQDEVLNPVLPNGLSVTDVPPQGAFRGGLLLRPADSGQAAPIVHFHGGGFIVGSPETHRVVGAWLAQVMCRPVLMPRYRLSPEHVLPDQAKDAAVALDYAVTRFGPGLTLSGDSAGAMMALWAFSHAPESQRQAVKNMLLLYAAFGLNPEFSQTTDEDLGLGPKSIAAVYDRLDPSGLIGTHLKYTPLMPEFPMPAHVVIMAAGDDPLLGESHALALAHPDCSDLFSADGMPHGFLSVKDPSLTTLPWLEQIKAALENGKHFA